MSKAAKEQWVVLLAQLPAAPSSARVALWRRMRAAGATSVLNGAWVLPASTEHRALLVSLAEGVRTQGGQATVLEAQSAEEDEAIVDQFRADRAREYAEFQERCRGFLDEIDKERRVEKFTFAELEELEDDYEKLGVWLAKIRARDFFPSASLTSAESALRDCDSAREAFAEDVYAREGLHTVGAPADPAP